MIIVADPPWRFGDKLPGKGRGAAKHYDTLSAEQIIWHAQYRDIARRDAHAVLLLWRVAALQPDALRVAEAWGFTVKSEIVWEKLTRTGKPHFGMGHYVRASHETCLLCVRGRPKVKSHSVRSRFAAPVGRHSEKPDAFYELVERLFPGPYVELFARRRRAGWTCLGNEVE